MLVCTGGAVSGPAVELPHGYRTEEMDLRASADIERWLLLHNDAFGRHLGLAEYRSGVLDHPHYDILRTVFLVDSRGPIGAASAGVFRRNRDVGVAHYIAIARRGQGLGLGKVIAGQQARAVAELGVASAETETQIGRTASLCLQFWFGFEPKYHLDEWNTPDTASPVMRAITNARLRRLRRQWEARHRS